jgi:hypothetical protein
MKNLVLAALSLMSLNAFADGFVCENLNENIRVKAFNHVRPEQGTRDGAIMILSNPSVSEGRKTIATFSEAESLLTNDAATYTAAVDLRYKDSARKGELVAGTKLGELKHIILDVDFTYSKPVQDGTELAGELILKKRNGDEDIRVDVTCIRYLKGE